jgi:NADH-ubiquinone oxidoreductase chain 4
MDLNLREFNILIILVIFTVALGIYPSIITDGLNYVAQGLLYTFDGTDNIITTTNNGG